MPSMGRMNAMNKRRHAADGTWPAMHKEIRVIIDSDAGCECDDQYAIVHGLMSRKVDLVGVIAEQFGAPEAETMERSYEEICRVVALAEKTAERIPKPALERMPKPLPAAVTVTGHTVAVYRGVCGRFRPDGFMAMGGTPAYIDQPGAGGTLVSEGTEFLINEARRDDGRPLFVIGQGALTNMAWALAKAPDITGRMVVVMIGGAGYPAGKPEFNTMNDVAAFNYVMESPVPVWVIPEEVYSTLQVGFMEIREKVRPHGPLGQYLANQMDMAQERLGALILPEPGQNPWEYSLGFPNGESWSLGDSAGIGILLAANAGTYKEVPAPRVDDGGCYSFPPDSKLVRWYEHIDGRFILEDFFAKLKYYYG